MLNNPIRNNVYIFLMLTIGIQKAPLNAATHIVDQSGNGDHFTIESAVQASSPGDTVFLNAGVYPEHSIIIDTPIHFVGINRNSVIWTSQTGNLASIYDSDQYSFREITFDSQNISVNNHADIYIYDCLIKDSGIYVSGNYGVDLYVFNSVISGSLLGSNNINGSKRAFIENSIFYNPTGFGSYLLYNVNTSEFNNCIFIGTNHNPQYHQWGHSITVLFSCLYNSFSNEGYGNITDDPILMDPANGDYRLGADSPCIDSGNTIVLYNDSDGSRNDMGVYGGPKSWGGSGPIITNLTITPTSAEVGETISIEATATTE